MESTAIRRGLCHASVGLLSVCFSSLQSFEICHSWLSHHLLDILVSHLRTLSLSLQQHVLQRAAGDHVWSNAPFGLIFDQIEHFVDIVGLVATGIGSFLFDCHGTSPVDLRHEPTRIRKGLRICKSIISRYVISIVFKTSRACL